MRYRRRRLDARTAQAMTEGLRQLQQPDPEPRDCAHCLSCAMGVAQEPCRWCETCGERLT